MGVYVQCKGKLKKLGADVTADEVKNALGYTPADAESVENIVDDGSAELYITDKEGNIIAMIDADGIHAPEMELGATAEDKVKVKEHIKNDDIHTTAEEKKAAEKHIDDTTSHITEDERKNWNNKTSLPNIIDDESNTFYLTDANGNIIFKIDKEGVHSIEMTLGDTESAVKVKEHIQDEVKHITAEERKTWNGKSDFDGKYSSLSGAPDIDSMIERHAEQTSHITEEERTTWNNKSDFSGSYNDLKDLPEIPDLVTKESLGLENVDNTADTDKPVSTAQQTALDMLQKAMSEQIVSESEEWHVVDNNGNIVATINKEGVHTTEVVLPGGKVSELISNHTGDTVNPHGVTKAQVGLAKVDNTSDADKPVSTAQQAAIDKVQSNLDSHTDDNDIHITAEERTKWNEGIGGSTLNVISLAGSATSGTFTDDVYALITSDPKSCVIKYGDTPSYYLYFSLYINVSGGIYEYRNTLTGMECKIQITSSKTWTYTTTNYVPATGGTFTGNVTVEGDFVANYVAGKFGLYAGDMYTEDGTYTVYAENHISIVTIENGVGSSKMFMLPSKSCTLGGQLYRHNIVLYNSTRGITNNYVKVTIISAQADEYTIDTLATFLQENQATASYAFGSLYTGGTMYPASGLIQTTASDGTTVDYAYVDGLLYSTGDSKIYAIGQCVPRGGASGCTAGLSIQPDTIKDIVVEM